MDRRKFLLGTGAVIGYSLILPRVAAATVGHTLAQPQRHLLAGCYTSQVELATSNSYGKKAVNVPGEIGFLDLATNIQTSIPVACWGHSVVQHSLNPSIFVAIEKYTPVACVVDFAKKSPVATLAAPDGMDYLGHGIFDSNGDLFISAQKLGEPGELLVYDSKTWKLKRRFPSGGRDPHQMIMISPDKIVLNNSHGLDSRRGALSWINLNDGSISRQERIPQTAHLVEVGPDHFALGGHNDKNPQAEFYAFNHRENHLIYPTEAAGFNPSSLIFGEALSLARISDSKVAVTTAYSGNVAVWDIKSNIYSFKAVPKEAAKWATGLVLWQNRLITNARSGKMYAFALSDETLSEATPAFNRDQPLANSYHTQIFVV